jgi:hypothetical protein
MKTKYVLFFSVIASLSVGFLAGHFQAANSWEHKCSDDFYTECGGNAFVYARILSDLRGENRGAAFTNLEVYLDVSLASLQPLNGHERNNIVEDGIQKARYYRLEHPWHGSPLYLEKAASNVLATENKWISD